MTIEEKVTKAINDYVSSNGTAVAEAIKLRFDDLLEYVKNVFKTMLVTVVPDKIEKRKILLFVR